MRRKSKTSIRSLEDKLWQECRRICYERDKDSLGRINCFTCDAEDIQGSNRQLGHVPYPKSVLGAFLKYDTRCLRWQCYNCNINRGGMGGEAYKRYLEKFGKRFLNKIEKDRQKITKSSDYYSKLLKKYGNL